MRVHKELMKIAVTSKSFSKNVQLRKKLLDKYPEAKFNDQEVTFNDQTLIHFLQDSEKAIIGLEKINASVLAELPKLKIISKYGVGCDNIDFEALEKRNVLFGYTAGTNKRGVSELALQMMLVLLRKSYQANQLLKTGSWSPQFGNNLTNKTIGILGLGNVGKDLSSLLAPFGCRILVCDIKPDFKYIESHRIELTDLENLFSQSDIVTLHIPLNSSTKGMVNEKLLSKMKPTALLINTSRGGIVNEAALCAKLKEKKIAAAGFDVFEVEPVQNSDLIGLENFYSTPHIGGSSVESILAMGEAAIWGLENAQKVIDLKLG